MVDFSIAFWITVFTSTLVAPLAFLLGYYIRNTIEFITMTIFVIMVIWSLLFVVILSNLEIILGVVG